jgi:hypothetical protein
MPVIVTIGRVPEKSCITTSSLAAGRAWPAWNDFSRISETAFGGQRVETFYSLLLIHSLN